MKERQVDIVIIGSGSAGLNAMAQARQAGRSFVLINGGTAGTTDKTGQQAGMEAKPTDGKTRAELKAERAMKKAQKKADKNLAVMGWRRSEKHRGKYGGGDARPG